ncbi:unnamed protein product, partial [Sphagnum jensenii]
PSRQQKKKKKKRSSNIGPHKPLAFPMNMASFIVGHSITILSTQPRKVKATSQIKSNSLKLSPPRT